MRTDTKTQSPDVAFRCQRSQRKGKMERAEVGNREAAAEVGSREAAVWLIAALAADHRTEPVLRETSRIRMRMLRRRKQKAPLPPSPLPEPLGQSSELFRSEGNHFGRTKQWVISPILHSNSQSPKHFNAMTGYEKKYLFQ